MDPYGSGVWDPYSECRSFFQDLTVRNSLMCCIIACVLLVLFLTEREKHSKLASFSLSVCWATFSLSLLPGLYVQGIYRKSPGASSKRAVKAALEEGDIILHNTLDRQRVAQYQFLRKDVMTCS